MRFRGVDVNDPIPLVKIEETLSGLREPQIDRGSLRTPPVETWKPIGDDGVRIPPGIKAAGVIMGFIQRSTTQGASLVFTKRSSMVRFHKGEISFPGGEFDIDTDRSLQDTAIREMGEEMGITPEQIQVLGQLSGVGVTSGYWVVPYPAILDPATSFSLNPREVESVLEVPLHELFDIKIHSLQHWEKDKHKFPIHVFKWRNQIIWGATGNLVWHLIQTLQERI
ncbi:MAG: NUDIX hydrolase [Candidatus Ranarchaeia archaeon]